MMELSLFLSQKKATILKVKHKKKILSLPCLFFFLSCSSLSRTSNRSVTLSVWPEYPKIPGTRCACPRMTEEKIILSSPYFYSFLVIPVFFSSPLSFPCLARESKRDVRLKAEHDKLWPAWHGNLKEIFGPSPNMTGKSSRMTEEKIILSLSDLIRQSRKEMSGSRPNMT